jgi:hypothetical protein
LTFHIGDESIQRDRLAILAIGLATAPDQLCFGDDEVAQKGILIVADFELKPLFLSSMATSNDLMVTFMRFPWRIGWLTDFQKRRAPDRSAAVAKGSLATLGLCTYDARSFHI